MTMTDIKDRYKVIVVGNSNVGKSCLVNRWISNEFKEDIFITIGLDSYVKKFHVDSKPILMLVWDIAGNERFRPIVPQYFSGADGVVLVYDVMSRKSFDDLACWIQTLKKQGVDTSNATFALVANKIDVTDKHHVSPCEGKAFAKIHGMPIFVQSSAKHDVGIDRLFSDLVSTISEQRVKNRSHEPGHEHILSLFPSEGSNTLQKSRGCFSCIMQ